MISTMMWLYDEGSGIAQREYANVGNATLEYTRVAGRACISRIITTDPNCYLDPRFSVGKDITELIQ